MVIDVNTTLLLHLATGAGAAYLLRLHQPKLVSLARSFFEARTDIRRLTAAQDVAQGILLMNDLTDLIEIRDIVAKQELRRQIKYGKQQDHTAHTVYLYFLGLYLYDNLPQLTEAVGKKCKAQRPIDRDKYFLLQWAYASLLHDIGYAFHNLELDTQQDRKLIDDVFSWEWVNRQCSALSTAAAEALHAAHQSWSSKYAGAMPPGTASYAADSHVDVLRRLAHAPWLGDLSSQFQGKDIFDVLDRTSSLRHYAFEVATKGYGGQGRCVDHAVGSGLFLFQYASFWYWLMYHVKRTAPPDVYRQAAGGYDYKARNLRTDIIAACRAVAFHNIQPATDAGKLIIPRLTLKDDPITFLAILCDELQRWDRYPAGWMYLDQYRVFSDSALESRDIEILCNGTRENPEALFVIHKKPGVSDQKEFLDDFRKTLMARLPEFSQVLNLAVRKPL